MFAYKQVILQLTLEIRAALKTIYGIGKYKALCICARMGLAHPFIMKNLNNYYFMVLAFLLDFYSWLEARIKRFYSQNIKRLVEINIYRGLRHKDNLPTRGQRTRTNAKTKKKVRAIFND